MFNKIIVFVAATVAVASAADMCHTEIRQQCAKELASQDVNAMVACVKKMTPSKSCAGQLQGSLAEDCSSDFALHCAGQTSAPNPRRFMETCVLRNRHQFSEGCQTALTAFQTKLQSRGKGKQEGRGKGKPKGARQEGRGKGNPGSSRQGSPFGPSHTKVNSSSKGKGKKGRKGIHGGKYKFKGKHAKHGDIRNPFTVETSNDSKAESKAEPRQPQSQTRTHTDTATESTDAAHQYQWLWGGDHVPKMSEHRGKPRVPTAAIVGGAALLLVTIVLAVCCIRRRRKRARDAAASGATPILADTSTASINGQVEGFPGYEGMRAHGYVAVQMTPAGTVAITTTSASTSSSPRPSISYSQLQVSIDDRDTCHIPVATVVV